jgi:shikimate kinase/3-dehydroquinate synthase
VATDTLEPETVAELLLGISQRDPWGVAAGDQSYAVDIGDNVLETRIAPGLAGASGALLVSDQTVFDLFGARMHAALRGAAPKTASIVIAPGEQHKNHETLAQIWAQTLASEADRKSRFVGFGGGVVTDITGFAAATFMRGVPWLSVPTTLLSMVDASVGGKTAIDLPGAKNAVGAFWQPAAVLCDTSTLVTESPRGYRSGLAEVIKTGIIGDPGLLDLLENEADRAGPGSAELNTELVRRSIRVKARVVSEDALETGFRAALNLGHTVGHAIEAVGGYGRHTHGEAVSLGLVAALKIGEALGTTPESLTRRITTLLARVGLPTDLGREPLDQAVALLGHDKKRAGAGVRFVLAQEPGTIRFQRLELDELGNLVRKLA